MDIYQTETARNEWLVHCRNRYFGQLLLPVLLGWLMIALAAKAHAHDITALVKKVKPSVVGIGIFDPLGAPRTQLHGTGFAIGDGRYVATNQHVIAHPLQENSTQYRIVLAGEGSRPQVLRATVVAEDAYHDLAILKLERALPPMSLNIDARIDDGSEIAFTGFPIGAVLGLYPATHQGIVAAYTPVVIPSDRAGQLSSEMLRRLRDPYSVYQLDAVAYPGNSGSPVYDAQSGKVVAVINKVFVKQTKESALSDPSGITYAIPVQYLRKLAASIDIQL